MVFIIVILTFVNTKLHLLHINNFARVSLNKSVKVYIWIILFFFYNVKLNNEL